MSATKCILILAAMLGTVTGILATIDQSVRDTSAYHRAMSDYHRTHPACAWCGSLEKVETHHIKPLWLDPSAASDTNNYISLCRRDHLAVGHAGSFGFRAVTNVAELCVGRVVVKREVNEEGQ